MNSIGFIIAGALALVAGAAWAQSTAPTTAHIKRAKTIHFQKQARLHPEVVQMIDTKQAHHRKAAERSAMCACDRGQQGCCTAGCTCHEQQGVCNATGSRDHRAGSAFDRQHQCPYRVGAPAWLVPRG